MDEEVLLSPLASNRLGRRLCVGLLVFILFARISGAQDAAASVRSFTNNLLKSHSELRQNRLIRRDASRADAALLIKQRAAALRDLIQQDPREALSLALPSETLAELAAAFPESASELEAHESWVGTIERWVADSADLKSHRNVIQLVTGGKSLEIYFAGPEPPGLTSGSLLTASGVRVGTEAVVLNSDIQGGTALKGKSATDGARAAGQTCSTVGVQNTAVLLVTFPGIPLPAGVTSQTMQDTFFGTTGHSLDGYWREASYGSASAAGNVFGPYALNSTYTCPALNQARDEAIAAATAAGVNFQNYSRIFLIYPGIGCVAGYAQVGCSAVSSPTGSFNASTTYIAAGYMSGDMGVCLATHEGGHNLGLLHGGSRDYGTEALGPAGATGTVSEMNDVFSTMGGCGSTLGHYSAPHKAQALNWLAPTTNYQVVQSSGTWSIQPLETNPAGLQALKIQRGTGGNAWLWVEYRQPTGNYDSTLPYSQPFSGALIHYQDDTTGAATHLLDFTPETDSWWDPGLVAGKTWVDPYTNVSISVQSATATALTLSVNYGAVPCASANPTVSASPLNLSTQPGGNVAYSVVVTNNDSPGCAPSTFSLSSSKPAGWAGSFSASSLTLGSGQSGTVTMTKNAPPSAQAGIYAADATATMGTLSGSGLANITVTAIPPLAVSVSTPSLTYAVRQAVLVTATVLYGGAPAAGASVTFTMAAGGGTFTKTVTTDSSGKAVWNYKIGPKGPRGLYSVTGSATHNSQTVTSSAATFTVQ